jgi:hypothetical protein
MRVGDGGQAGKPGQPGQPGAGQAGGAGGEGGEGGQGEPQGPGGGGGGGGEGAAGAVENRGPRGFRGEGQPPLFRRILIAWMILFSIAVCWAIISGRNTAAQNRKIAVQSKQIAIANREAINGIRRNRATIGQLQSTNCALKKFLLRAREARLRTASHSSGAERRIALRTARGYFVLAQSYVAVGPHCKINH